MFKKIGLTVLILSLMVGVAFAGGVTDSNNGNKGDIFVSTGENNGNNSVGEWLDGSSFKGEKGDTGATGLQGIQGVKGDTGAQGIQGVKGNTGAKGIQGVKGDTGAQGIQGIAGQNGTDGINGTNGINGLNGTDGKDVDPITVDNLKNRDITLQNNIDTETTNRKDNDNLLQQNININDSDSKLRDNHLQDNINTESDTRKDNDNILQTNINNESTIRHDSDVTLQNNINNESNIRSNADNVLQNNINATNGRVDQIDKRVNTLEQTQGIVGAEIRLYDSKKITITTFADYTTNRQMVDRAGVKITYKIGMSYEERELAKLNKRLDKLENIKTQKQNIENAEPYFTQSGLGIRSKF